MEAVPRMPMVSLDLKFSPVEEDEFGPVIRKCAVQVSQDFEGCSILRKYYGQLQYLQSRFPMGDGGDAAVPFTWSDVYSGKLISFADIRFEQASILYNLAALHSILGSTDNRMSEEGMKVSCTHFQCAAGAFSYLRDHFGSLPTPDTSFDMLNFYINLMLGQAQECLLEKSMQDNRKPSLVARISMQVVAFYTQGLRILDTPDATQIIGTKHHKEWKRLLQIKINYFTCIAHLFMGNQADEQQKFGEKVTYYKSAFDKLTEAVKLAKGQVDTISEALQFTMDVVGGKYGGAKKDNDFVYHETVPPIESMPELKGASLVKALPFQPIDTSVTGPDIFERLVPMEAHEYSSMYSEEKAKLLRQVVAEIELKDEQLHQYLESLDLTQLLETPESNRLPQSLLEKCAAMSVRQDTMKTLSASMQVLSSVRLDVEEGLTEVEQLVGDEKVKEKDFQDAYGPRSTSIICSEIARELDKYKEAHAKASQTSTDLRTSMSTHVNNLKLLSGPLDVLQAALPSQNIMDAPVDENVRKNLKMLKEKVEEMQQQRKMLENQLREQIQNDDITQVLVTRDQGNLEDLFKQELKKYDQVIAYIHQNLAAQDNILKALTEVNAKYAATRKASIETEQRRQNMVQSLIASYDANEDLLAKCQKGVDFYQKLQTNVSKLLQRTRGVCKVQEEERQQIMDRTKSRRPKKPPARPTAPKPNLGPTAASMAPLPTPITTGGPYNLEEPAVGVFHTVVPPNPPQFSTPYSVRTSNIPAALSVQSNLRPSTNLDNTMSSTGTDGSLAYGSADINPVHDPLTAPTQTDFQGPPSSWSHHQNTPAQSVGQLSSTTLPQSVNNGQTYPPQWSFLKGSSEDNMSCGEGVMMSNLHTQPYQSIQQQPGPVQQHTGGHMHGNHFQWGGSGMAQTVDTLSTPIVTHKQQESLLPAMQLQEKGPAFPSAGQTQELPHKFNPGQQYDQTTISSTHHQGRFPVASNSQQQAHLQEDSAYGIQVPQTVVSDRCESVQHSSALHFPTANLNVNNSVPAYAPPNLSSEMQFMTIHPGTGQDFQTIKSPGLHVVTNQTADGTVHGVHPQLLPSGQLPLLPQSIPQHQMVPTSQLPFQSTQPINQQDSNVDNQNVHPVTFLANQNAAPGRKETNLPNQNVLQINPSAAIASHDQHFPAVGPSAGMVGGGSILQPVPVMSSTGNTGTDDLLSSSPEGEHQALKDSHQVLMPKVLTNEDKQELLRKTEKTKLLHEPYNDQSSLDKLLEEVNKLEKIVEGLEKKMLSGQTKLESDWKSMMEAQEKESRQKSISVARCYSMKNRHPDIMPYDQNRVKLSSLKDDYINASHIVHYENPSCPRIIATQAPLPSTYAEFWTMVYEQQVSVIIMLLNQEESGKKWHCYWPAERGVAVNYGQVTVSLYSIKTLPTHIERMFNISHKETRLMRSVVHLQFTGWPDGKSVPDSPDAFLQFQKEVLEYHRQQRSLQTPMVVHCSDGVGRTGVFCLLAAAVSDINTERPTPDLVSLVHQLRMQRKYMISEKAHLQFCYKAVLAHIENLLIKRGILRNKSPEMQTADTATEAPKVGYTRLDSFDPLSEDAPLTKVQSSLEKLSKGEGTDFSGSTCLPSADLQQTLGLRNTKQERDISLSALTTSSPSIPAAINTDPQLEAVHSSPPAAQPSMSPSPAEMSPSPAVMSPSPAVMSPSPAAAQQQLPAPHMQPSPSLPEKGTVHGVKSKNTTGISMQHEVQGNQDCLISRRSEGTMLSKCDRNTPVLQDFLVNVPSQKLSRKTDFEQRKGGLDVQKDPADPFSLLDPFWTMKTE
ncbi:tyrosine-protein phosphatase non-receptor type 23-like isoform X2 [Branchiostoma floridae]|uniref:Tyrosine-protein phosphatase non-receptor type 23-like isoform X2 n=1 Tax=Branchiostoma floridae TaxID=7739 RepID=A0A9J7HNP2_BRAFL|nr:tyrosine-protein phosphatase non-receptor type 23-like isoform X2 [Branchiostoma floridae]